MATSKAYQAASEAATQASKEFRAAQLAYRSLQVGDDAFLAAKAKHDAAQKLFDIAFAKEANHA
jgi:hypothetical protein